MRNDAKCIDSESTVNDIVESRSSDAERQLSGIDELLDYIEKEARRRIAQRYPDVRLGPEQP